MFINHLYAFHNVLTPEGQPLLPPEEFLRQWTVDDIDEMVYEHSTDMLAPCRRPSPTCSGTACRPGRSAPSWPPAAPTARCSGARSTRWRAAAPST